MTSPLLALLDRLSIPADIAPADGPVTYSVLGLSLACDCTIPGLGRAVSPSGSPDVQLVMQGVPEWIREKATDAREPFYVSPFSVSGAPALRAWTIDGAADDRAIVRLLHWDGVECFVERSGARVWIAWPGQGPSDPIDFLLGFVIAFVRRLRGMVCLHAAVVCGHRAVALAGRPGVGKSTLAAALAIRGYPVLTDDVAAIATTAGGYLVQPGPSRVRVRRRSADQLTVLGGTPVAWTPSPGGDYVDLDLSQRGFSQPLEAMPLGSICLLDPRARSQPTFEPWQPVDALVELLRDTWATRLQDRTLRAQEFDAVGRMVAGTMICRMTYDADAAWVNAACRLLERSLLVDDFRETPGA